MKPDKPRLKPCSKCGASFNPQHWGTYRKRGVWYWYSWCPYCQSLAYWYWALRQRKRAALYRRLEAVYSF